MDKATLPVMLVRRKSQKRTPVWVWPHLQPTGVTSAVLCSTACRKLGAPPQKLGTATAGPHGNTPDRHRPQKKSLCRVGLVYACLLLSLQFYCHS